jgi:4-amino-4-deoxy-L-arabinose transferase-like glycosyltransferase
MIPPLVNTPRRLLLAGLPLVLALHLGLLWLGHRPAPRRLWGDEVLYLRAADEVAAGAPRGADDLLWPPGYSRVLASLLAAGDDSILFVQLVQTALLALAAWIFGDLVRRLLASPFAGALAALLMLAYPPLVAFAHFLWPEVLHLALALAAVWIVAARRERLAWMILLGLALGLALLTKSLLGPFVPLLLLPVARERGWRRGLPRAALAAAVAFAVLLPTMLANRRQQGVFAVADSVRFNLWVGLTDGGRHSFGDGNPWRAYQVWQRSARDLRRRDTILDWKLRHLVAERGVGALLAGQLGRQYFRLFDKDSVLTEMLPGGILAARGYGYRAPPAWAAALLRWGSYAAYAVLLVAAAAGAALGARRAGGWAWLALAFLAYNLALFLLLHATSRYRVQLLPVLFLFAVAAGERLRRWMGARRGEGAAPPPASRWEWIAAATAAAVALGLAFGGALLG